MKRQNFLDVLFELAFTAERQEVQVSACVAWLNWVEGKPRAQSIQIHANDLATLNDDALDREIQRLRARINKYK